MGAGGGGGGEGLPVAAEAVSSALNDKGQRFRHSRPFPGRTRGLREPP